MAMEVLQAWLDQNAQQTGISPEITAHNDTHTYTIVSKVAYLIGVPKKIFENEHEPPQLSEYEELEQNKSARIIRNLCILRASIERNFGVINKEISRNYKTINSLPQYVPQDAIMALSQDGISLSTKKGVLAQYIVELNQHINNRINNVKDLFPIWLNWDYLKDIFIMPKGLSVAGTKAAADEYYAKRDFYPYQIYINWPASDQGNILFNDKRFVTLLYEWNCDEFSELSKVSDADSVTKISVHQFLHTSQRAVLVVDCENSDPFALCAALDSLDEDVLEKVQKIILYDDIHTTEAWQSLAEYTQIPVEHIQIERVKEDKSLVDIRLATGVCREFYTNSIESFVLVSSDSDYWGLISAMPEARFLVMVEHDKCGPDLKQALLDKGIFYCYVDDFYSAEGSSSNLKKNLVLQKISSKLNVQFQINLNDLLNDTLRSLRVYMNNSEKKQFIDRHLRTIQMRIDEEGNLSLELKNK